jgi:hypothetical protein
VALSDEKKSAIRALTFRLVRDAKSDVEGQEIALEIERLCPDPYYLQYIFYPEIDGALEEVVERALVKVDKHRPIAL